MECSKAHMLLAASYCRQAGTQGNDAEMVLLRAAAALGAIEKSSFILPKHIEEAAVYVLPHRMHEVQGESESQEEPEESRQEQPAEDAGEDASLKAQRKRIFPMAAMVRWKILRRVPQIGKRPWILAIKQILEKRKRDRKKAADLSACRI